ncbi:MAG: AAA family ATPase [Pseudomonadaceae bacterium]|nr:AAA family ATPase [Pseudomonadaceae bacterium]
MYNDHFHFDRKPFSIAPDPAFLYMSDGHREALAHLTYGLTDGGFVLVTGEVGTGKTTLLRNLIGQVPDEVDVAFVLNPRLTVRELLATICEELGIVIADDTQSIKAYIDSLNRHLLKTHAAGRSTVVIIDEAQNLSPAVLEQLRLLTNLETNEKKLLRIILIGQPELGELLARQELRQLAQRVTARYHLSQLSREDAGNYVRHRILTALKDSGGSVDLFSDKAISALHKRSAGIPRVMNVIADRALLGAYVEGKRQVDETIVHKAASETLGAVPARKQLVPAIAIAATIIAFALAAVVLLMWLPETEEDVPPAVSAQPTAEAGPQNDVATSTPDSALTASSTSNAARDRLTEQPVNRPTNMTALDTQQRAFSEVFRAWSTVYPVPNTTAPCDFAVALRLQCLSRKGTWSDVEQLDLPVVLELWDERSKPFYAALLSSNDGQLTLSVAGQTIETTARVLRDMWVGAYVALWHRPTEYQRNLAPGDRGAAVRWVREALVSAGFIEATGSGDPNAFDLELQASVRAFQRREGIASDGIVGPETWVQLQNVQRPNRPSLSR